MISISHVKPDVNVFPNPFNEEFKIFINNQIAKSNNRKLKIYSTNGQLIFEKIINTNETVDASSFPLGIYFYQIFEDNRIVSTGKLIKH